MKSRRTDRTASHRRRPRRSAPPARRRVALEALEDRMLMSAGLLSGFAVVDAQHDPRTATPIDTGRSAPIVESAVEKHVTEGRGTAEVGTFGDDLEPTTPRSGSYTGFVSKYSDTGPWARPDLRDRGDGWSFFGADVVAPGDPWECQFVVENGGLVDAGPFDVDFYAATLWHGLPWIGNPDLFLGRVSVAGLEAGQAAVVELNLADFPTGLAPNDYYVGISIDPANAVTESNEFNNKSFDTDDYPLTVTAPDLTAGGGGWWSASPVSAGDPWQVSFVVDNAGTADADPYRVTFVASTDGTITPQDHLLGSAIMPGLAAGQEATATVDLLDFPSLPGGNYVVGAMIDSGNDVIESDEGNNIWHVGLTPLLVTAPDLYDTGDFWNSFNPDTVKAGDPWHATFDIRNGGNAHSGQFFVGFYASTDTDITLQDHYLGGRVLSNVAPGTSANVDLDLTHFPDDVPAGTYYVGIVIDVLDNVNESNETNNQGVDLNDYPLTVLLTSKYVHANDLQLQLSSADAIWWEPAPANDGPQVGGSRLAIDQRSLGQLLVSESVRVADDADDAWLGTRRSVETQSVARVDDLAFVKLRDVDLGAF